MYFRLRRVGFHVIDFLNGNSISNHLLDLSAILTNVNTKISKHRRKVLLDRLLNGASQTVPYYSLFKDKALEDYPVITKTEIRANFESFQSLKYKKKKLHKVTTSGSTGIPFSVYQNKNKKDRNKADALYFLKKTGYKLGDRIYYFRLWKGEYKSRINSFLQNIVKIEISKLSAPFIKSIIEDASLDPAKKVFFGLASSFDALSDYLQQTNIEKFNLNLISLVAISEALSPETKINLQKVFDAPVISRYSNEEQGIIAQQSLNSNGNFEINWGSYYVEIFDLEKDVLAPLETLGRIIVTDLFNYSMPLIRYDTGDIGIMSEINGEFVLSKIEGRKLDAIYNSKGEHISSYTIYPIMSKYYERFHQYQFIQTGEKDYLIKLNIIKSFPDEQQLIKDFRLLLGADSKIKVEYVKEIPVLSSGKRKKVVNTYCFPLD
jgi:phenylacetate-CoA ligase